MADTDTLVTETRVERIDTVSEGADVHVARAAGRGADALLSVHFPDGAVGLLDLSEPRAVVWASVLRSLLERRRPAYVEIDPRTRLIAQLLLPRLHAVGEIEPLDERGDLRVELFASHALHILRRAHPLFNMLLALLRAAREQRTQVWVTETPDVHEIIDVRADPPGKP